MHIGAAILYTGVVCGVGVFFNLMWLHFFAFVTNGAFWMVREALQARRSGRYPNWYNPATWSIQKKWEGWAPLVCGAVVVLISIAATWRLL